MRPRGSPTRGLESLLNSLEFKSHLSDVFYFEVKVWWSLRKGDRKIRPRAYPVWSSRWSWSSLHCPRKSLVRPGVGGWMISRLPIWKDSWSSSKRGRTFVNEAWQPRAHTVTYYYDDKGQYIQITLHNWRIHFAYYPIRYWMRKDKFSPQNLELSLELALALSTLIF